eukprot:scaffold8141_cov139-Skeletonema_dohrnii-CCMP3373.AAC.13
MSLLAMIADNFELEQPPADDEVDDHECLLMDMNSTDDADATFATAKEATSNSDDGSNGYVEYHDVLKQRRNDSEGTAETEQSFDSTGSNNPHYAVVNTDDTITSSSRPSQEMKLLLTFLLMVVVGTGMKIFQKLQAIPYVTFAIYTPMHQFVLFANLVKLTFHLSSILRALSLHQNVQLSKLTQPNPKLYICSIMLHVHHPSESIGVI